MSADGRFVAFVTANNLVFGIYFLGVPQAVVHDSQSGATTLASANSVVMPADATCADTRVSSDGRYVAFDTRASNLVGPSGGHAQVYLHDRYTGTLTVLSVSSNGGLGDADSSWPVMSANGRFVAFQSQATDLVVSDANGVADVFVRDTSLVCTPVLSTYCSAKVDSLGCIPSISATGNPSLTSEPDTFFVIASPVMNHKTGILLWSHGPASTPFGGGLLCVASPIKRTSAQNSGGTATGNDCTGSYSFHFSQAYLTAQGINSGSTIYCQFWSRDPYFPPPYDVGLTNGLSFSVCP
jgi:Tol biopolymer transport system component